MNAFDILAMTGNKKEYFTPETMEISLHSLQIICESGDFNGIDTEIDENPDNWL